MGNFIYVCLALFDLRVESAVDEQPSRVESAVDGTPEESCLKFKDSKIYIIYILLLYIYIYAMHVSVFVVHVAYM